MMDYRSIKPSDIHPTSIFKERMEIQGQTVSIGHDQNQKWYYLDSQRTNEVTFIKIWDSKDDVAKRKCRQTSFLTATTHLMLKVMGIESALANYISMPPLCFSEPTRTR
jgi:hypothetical protein